MAGTSPAMTSTEAAITRRPSGYRLDAPRSCNPAFPAPSVLEGVASKARTFSRENAEMRLTFVVPAFAGTTMNRACRTHRHQEAINKMTARGGQILLVAINLLAFFVALLRLDRKRGDGAGFQPLQRDRLASFLAIAVGVVLDALQRRIDLGVQLALAVAGAQLDRAVGLRGGAVGEIGMVDVLFLQGLQRDPRFLEDFVLPRQQLGAKIIALAVVHERLFFGGSIILQLFQGQPICTFCARFLNFAVACKIRLRDDRKQSALIKKYVSGYAIRRGF